jgi:hypothetical protein
MSRRCPLDRTDDRGVDRVIHPEVVSVDDEHPGIRSEPQRFAGPRLPATVVHDSQYREPAPFPAAETATDGLHASLAVSLYRRYVSN